MANNVINMVRQIAWHSWTSAANAYRMYPNNKHTFSDYWANIGKHSKLTVDLIKQNNDLLEALKNAYFLLGHDENLKDIKAAIEKAEAT